MKVKEVADLVGISVRTLHHYDKIGLLVPDYVTETGYRRYSDANLETLQQILFFKELGFSLAKIKEIITSPTFDQLEALQFQREMLLNKQQRLQKMLLLVESTMKHLKGEIEMTNEEKFAGFDFSHNPYEQEARERWGDEAVDRSNKKLAEMTKGEQQAVTKQFEEIYHRIAAIRHLSPASEEAQVAIKEWYHFLNDNFGHHYSLEAFKGLGQMYVDDERFAKNIDKYGEGLAMFMRDAMAVFADKKTK